MNDMKNFIFKEIYFVKKDFIKEICVIRLQKITFIRNAFNEEKAIWSFSYSRRITLNIY